MPQLGHCDIRGFIYACVSTSRGGHTGDQLNFIFAWLPPKVTTAQVCLSRWFLDTSKLSLWVKLQSFIASAKKRIYREVNTTGPTEDYTTKQSEDIIHAQGG